MVQIEGPKFEIEVTLAGVDRVVETSSLHTSLDCPKNFFRENLIKNVF